MLQVKRRCCPITVVLSYAHQQHSVIVNNLLTFFYLCLWRLESPAFSTVLATLDASRSRRTVSWAKCLVGEVSIIRRRYWPTTVNRQLFSSLQIPDNIVLRFSCPANMDCSQCDMCLSSKSTVCQPRVSFTGRSVVDLEMGGTGVPTRVADCLFDGTWRPLLSAITTLYYTLSSLDQCYRKAMTFNSESTRNRLSAALRSHRSPKHRSWIGRAP